MLMLLKNYFNFVIIAQAVDQSIHPKFAVFSDVEAYSRLRLIEPPRDQVVLNRLSGETD